MDHSELQNLTKSLSAGDQHAWEELYKLLYDSVVLFLNRILRSQEDSYDIAQEVFIYLWQNLEKVDPDKSIKGYLYVISRTLAFRHLRRRARGDGEASSLSDMPDLSLEDISPEDIIMADETRILVAIALERMPRKRRQVFEMSRIEGLSNDEIADKLNLSKNTVKNHIANVTKELKELLYIVTVLFLGG